jgi:hypothetical protein
LNGPFAFSYSGDNSGGFLAVAGSFVADGAGNIVSGVEDVDSFSGGPSTAIAINGTYLVGPDGTGTISLNSGQQSVGTLQFTLTTNQHALLIRFDKNVTGGGAFDQQNLNDLTTSPSVISGPYVFSLAGADSNFNPMGLAGKFTANGSGTIPTSGTHTILDAKINGTVTTSDRTLTGTYAFDASRSGTGRGTITLTSGTTSSLQYTFYIVDNTHLHLVEIDRNNFLAGEVFAAPAGSSFATTELTSGNYSFTAGGTSSTGAYATGGVFVSNGGGNITGGVTDVNSAGTIQSNATLGSCAYTVDNLTGRIDLKLCPSGGNAAEFAAYQTSTGSAVMLELDSAATANGMAFKQTIPPAPVAGLFALNLTGQGIFHNSASSYQPDANGQITLAGTEIIGGSLDINNYRSIFQNDPIDTVNSAIVAPDSTFGRGTAVLEGTQQVVTFNLNYYIVDGNTALLLTTDTVFTMMGRTASQSPPAAQ